MGHILSNQEEINEIRIIDANSTPRKVQSVVSYDNTVIIKVDDNTIMVASKANKEKWAYPMSIESLGFRWIGNALKALCKLKMVSKDAVDAHVAQCAKNDAERDLKYDREAVERLAKKHGLKIPKAWEKALSE